MSLRELVDLLKTAAQNWWEDNTFRLGAALSFYAAFAIAPIGIIAIMVAGLVFGEETARRQLVHEINSTLGPQVGPAIGESLRQAHDSGSGPLATFLSLLVLLTGATTLFVELQSDLDTIWGVAPRPDRGWFEVVKDRFWSFLIVLGFGVLLILSLLIGTALSALEKYSGPQLLRGGAALWQAVHLLISLGLATLLFALIYKVLPDVELGLRDVWVGALVTAVLFLLGTYLIGLYLSRSGVASAYGAAGSIVVILLWVYYSSQVVLFGAEFTIVFAQRYGRPHVDERRAVPIVYQNGRRGIPCRAGVSSS